MRPDTGGLTVPGTDTPLQYTSRDPLVLMRVVLPLWSIRQREIVRSPQPAPTFGEQQAAASKVKAELNVFWKTFLLLT